MGYYTKYYFRRVDGPKAEYDAVLKEIDGCLGEDDAFSTEQVFAVWGRYENDMLAISRKHPDVVIQIDGTGEDNGDIWRDFWHGGKYHHEAMRLKEYDEIKMECYEILR